MKYYEIKEPYYALLKAEDELSAAKNYIKFVAGEENEIEEIIKELSVVPEYYAAVKYARAPGEGEKQIDFNIVIEDLEKEEEMILLIDGSLY